MSLVGVKAQNHPQQLQMRGVLDSVDDRATPPEWFAELHARFRFSIDVAAAPHNAKCERFYTREQNGLMQSWAGERVYCNPPYSDLEPWVRKAQSEWRQAEIIVLLVPANRTEQAWWQDFIEPLRDRGIGLSVEFLRGRRRFIAPDADAVQPNERPPFGVCLLIWRCQSDEPARSADAVVPVGERVTD
jgi:phage N-6-adenine-methyltransferase